MQRIGRNLLTSTTQMLVSGHGKLDLLEVTADAFGNALGNAAVGAHQAARQERAVRQVQADIAKEGPEYFARRMERAGGFTPEQIERVRKSENLDVLADYARRLSSAGKPFDQLSESEQQSLLRGMPLPEREGVDGVPVVARPGDPASAPVASLMPDGSYAHQLGTVQVIGRVPQGSALDYVAGGLTTAANAINELVDIVGGPERAEWLVGGVQAAVYGIPKTAVTLVAGELLNPGIAYVGERISDLLHERVFSGRASSESAKVLSDTLGSFAAEMVLGKAGGVVGSAQRYAVAKNEAVRPGQVGTYGELKAQKKAYGQTEALHMDHQPSFAAQVAAREAVLGRELSKAELSKLRANTPAVASPKAVHQETSPTYGGRNTPYRIAEDAANLDAAASRDRIIFDEAMRKR